MTNKDKMVYDDARSIGLDYESFKKLESIFNNHNNEANDQPNWFKDGNLNKYYEVK